jgi:hypothetical protein
VVDAGAVVSSLEQALNKDVKIKTNARQATKNVFFLIGNSPFYQFSQESIAGYDIVTFYIAGIQYHAMIRWFTVLNLTFKVCTVSDW